MSTPTQATVYADALAAHAALKDTANAAFIADADTIIAAAVLRGKYKVTLPVLAPASFSDIAKYYMDLGYGVEFDQCSGWQIPWNGQYPTQYPYGSFSSFYSFFYVCSCKLQCKMIISWGNCINP